jgi:Ni,Fe-hydrogenase maturation factor
MAAKKIKVFVFGNPLVEKDALALRVAEMLKGRIVGVEFEAIESLDDVESEGKLFVMDVALGIEKVMAIEDLDALVAKQPVSLHDFGLAFELRLLKKLGRVGRATIIAIPGGYPPEKACEESMALISSLP